MHKYRIFGLSLASDFPFLNRLAAGAPGDIPDITLTLKLGPSPFELQQSEPRYRSPITTEAGESVCRIFREAGQEIMRFPWSGDFVLAKNRIDVYLASSELRALAEIHFLGAVLAYWLERSGIPALHASAVDVGGSAIAFLSAHGGGKSGLAAAFLLSGLSLLTDDILPVEEHSAGFRGLSAYPQMRLWPDSARHFLPEAEGLPRVHPDLTKLRVPVGEGGIGSFQKEALPIEAIFTPRRAPAAEISLTPLPPTEALMALVAGSFSPYVVEAVGLQAHRLSHFSRLIRSVPILRLTYPSGFDTLPNVVEHILSSLGKRGKWKGWAD